jgi:hypothetical protein
MRALRPHFESQADSSLEPENKKAPQALGMRGFLKSGDRYD